MRAYRKRPVAVEATRILMSDFDTDHPHSNHVPGVVYDPKNRCVWITTLEGTMRGNPGDYIIRGIKGELYPCKADIFEATYEAIEEAAHA